jgi:hypothetical protein
MEKDFILIKNDEFKEFHEDLKVNYASLKDILNSQTLLLSETKDLINLLSTSTQSYQTSFDFQDNLTRNKNNFIQFSNNITGFIFGFIFGIIFTSLFKI